MTTVRQWSYNHNIQYDLYHHGILGMKWGVRRFQNKDGSLTKLGEKHRDDIEKAESNLQKVRQDHKKVKSEYNKDTWFGTVSPSVEVAEKLDKSKKKSWIR